MIIIVRDLFGIYFNYVDKIVIVEIIVEINA